MKTNTPAAVMRDIVEEALSSKQETGEGIGYIHPSSLARGCMLYVARELLRIPKEEYDSRVKRILEVGTSSHHRIIRYFSRVILAKEVAFVDEEYRIKGRCDAIAYIPPELGTESSGFYVVEIKTAGSTEYELIREAGEPKPEHLTQCLLYIWGLRRYYRTFPLQGGILYYENRDNLDYVLFDVEYEEARVLPLLERTKAMLAGLKEGRLPEDHLPLEHWAHGYCPYLSICEYGQEAIRVRRKSSLPDHTLAHVIARRIVSKQKNRDKVRKAPRSLEELSTQLNWE